MSGRLWLRIDPDKGLVVLEDGDGELVTSEEFRAVLSPRRLFLDCLAEVMREVVDRAPKGFETVHGKGFELRGPEPWKGFRKALQKMARFKVVQEGGGR